MTHPNNAGPALKPDEESGCDCERCQGTGEVVTDWERYMHSRPGDVGDEAVTACPDCNGTGKQDAVPALKPSDEARRLVEAFAAQSAYLWSDEPRHVGKGDLIELNRAEAALLAYIAYLEATPPNAGEAKPVAWRWRYPAVKQWTLSTKPPLNCIKEPLYAAPPHADLVAAAQCAIDLLMRGNREDVVVARRTLEAALTNGGKNVGN